MRFHRGLKAVGFFVLATLALSVTTGSNAAEVQSGAAEDAVLRLHWLGTTRMAQDNNAGYFLNLWNLPEAKALRDQVLGKLAGNPAAANTSYPMSKAFLEELLATEARLEFRQTGGSITAVGLALRLNPERADYWKPKLAQVASQLLKRRASEFQISARNGWSFAIASQDPAAIQSSLLTAIQRPSSGANYWLEAEADLAKLAQALDLAIALPSGLPRMHLTLNGEGEQVRTRARLDFPKPLNLAFTPLAIPTNLIREPLVSFTAANGIRPFLSAIPWIRELRLNPSPNQFFSWSMNTSPFHTFAIVPLGDASRQVDRFGPALEARLNLWMTNRGLAKVEFSQKNHGIAWLPIPLFNPAFQALPMPEGEVLLGRVSSSPPPKGELGPAELFNRIRSNKNLVYYSWEITEGRIKDWLFLSQSLRLSLRRAQLPEKAAVVGFLKAIAPKLGNTVTEVTLDGPSTLTLVRKSHSGFSGFEWHLLADWLEAPGFPSGLYTMEATRIEPFSLKQKGAKPLPPQGKKQ